MRGKDEYGRDASGLSRDGERSVATDAGRRPRKGQASIAVRAFQASRLNNLTYMRFAYASPRRQRLLWTSAIG